MNKPFRYEDNSEASRVIGRTEYVSLRVDHGVLVATLLVNSLMHEKIMLEIHQSIERNLPLGTKGLIVDVSRVTLPASSQFLGILMKIRGKLKQLDRPMAICGLSGIFREAFEIAQFGRVIDVYDKQSEALESYGDFSEWEQLHFDSRKPSKRSSDASADSQLQAVMDRLARLPAKRVSLAVAGLVAIFALWMLLPGDGPHPSYRPGLWDGVPRVSISGDVEYTSRGVKLADDGSVVLAWPVQVMPETKPLLHGQDLLAHPDMTWETGSQGPFFTRVVSGRYKLEVPVARNGIEYYVLVLSKNSDKSDVLSGADEQLLAGYFADPKALLNGHNYSITRCSLTLGAPTTVQLATR